MSILRFGSCSWKFPSWEGLVYSQAKDINYLAEYAQRYRTVEIDQWFWSLFDTDSISLPRTETVAEYLGSVDPDFRFTIKAPNAVTLTHFSTKGSQKGSGPNPYFLSVELFGDFLKKIEPMRELTGSVMLQFEYLNKQKMSGVEELCERTDAFLSALAERAPQWPVSIELRNPNYLRRPWFELLAKHRVAHVYCHGYYLPPAPAVLREATPHLGSPPPRPGILRLLGPDRQGIERQTGRKWNTLAAPRDHELPAIADMIVEMLSQGDVYVNVNNHYEGSAPLSIERLERLVDERRARFSQIR